MTTVGRAPRRILVALAVGAVLFAAGALVAAPEAASHAEASFTVQAPLTIRGVTRAIRAHAGSVQVSSRSELVVVTSAHSDRVATAARRGLEVAAREAAVAARRRAAAARAAQGKATADAAALIAITGLADPASAYQQRRANLADLRRERDAARSRGEPVGDLDARIAQIQQDVFDIKLQVQRRAELAQDQGRAARQAAAASTTADRATTAALSAEKAVQVADRRTAEWPRLGLVVASLVFAGAAIVASVVLRRPAELRGRKQSGLARLRFRPGDAGSTMARDDAILVEEALARARARRAAAAHHDERDPGKVSSPAENVKRLETADSVLDLRDGSGVDDATTRNVDLAAKGREREPREP